MTLFWDAAANPMDNPPSLKAGSTLTNTKLYLTAHSHSGRSHSQRCSGRRWKPDRDALKLTVNCKSDGAFSEPTGTSRQRRNGNWHHNC